MPLDVLIRNAAVIDGTGAPARREDVGVAGGKIVPPGAAKRVIDADGLVVAPSQQICAS